MIMDSLGYNMDSPGYNPDELTLGSIRLLGGSYNGKQLQGGLCIDGKPGDLLTVLTAALSHPLFAALRPPVEVLGTLEHGGKSRSVIRWMGTIADDAEAVYHLDYFYGRVIYKETYDITPLLPSVSAPSAYPYLQASY